MIGDFIVNTLNLIIFEFDILFISQKLLYNLFIF